MALDLVSRSGAATGSLIDFCRVNIIANAMDHTDYILQLRMIVNFNKQQICSYG